MLDAVPYQLFMSFCLIARLHLLTMRSMFSWWKDRGCFSSFFRYNMLTTVPGAFQFKVRLLQFIGPVRTITSSAPAAAYNLNGSWITLANVNRLYFKPF